MFTILCNIAAGGKLCVTLVLIAATANPTERRADLDFGLDGEAQQFIAAPNTNKKFKEFWQGMRFLKELVA